MTPKNILVVTGSSNETLLQWYGQAQQFVLTLANSHETAIELAQRQHFDLVLADGTDSAIHIRKLGAVLPILSDETALLAYEGESLGALDSKIKAIFDAKKAKQVQRLLILDASSMSAWGPLPPFSLN